MAAGWEPLHLVGARSQEDYTSQNAARKTLFPIGRIGLTTSPRMLQASPPPTVLHLPERLQLPAFYRSVHGTLTVRPWRAKKSNTLYLSALRLVLVE